MISAPTAVSPINGATTAGWPTFIVNDAARTGPASALVYRFDIGTDPTFATIIVTGVVAETPNQTSFTPPAGTPAPPQNSLVWRVIVIDPINVVASPATVAQPFTYGPLPPAAVTIAAQEGVVLWPGVQPPGTNGHAVLGNNWNVQSLQSFTGVTFLSPELEQIRIFDLLDRGMDPQSAINWMQANGYSTVAAWYASVQVIGFDFEYMALINGRWDLVVKVGA